MVPYKSGSYFQSTSNKDTKTANDFGGDWTNSNPIFSDDTSTHLIAIDMAQQQLNRKFKKSVIPET
jgi:hypothetical protein